MSDRNALDIARRLAQLNQREKACEAYALAIHMAGEGDGDAVMEGAIYNLQFGGDYKVSYDAFVDLHGRDCHAADCLAILTEAFYTPNEKELRARYERNRKLLSKYPYLFRKDFPPFEELPVRFYPYDDTSYVPYYRENDRFGEKIDDSYPVISRNFFQDLDKPLLAADVFSQYELEYLVDNVRKSEWVGRDNHIYLHYTDWTAFCAHLQHLELNRLLREEKVVFLVGDEADQYPIDFQTRFGIDYSRYPVRPVGIREVTRMIWHTQLSSHNGGDFFNEIFDGHPNLLYMSSLLFDEVEDTVLDVKGMMGELPNLRQALETFAHWGDPGLVKELYTLRDRTVKDVLVALYMAMGKKYSSLDPAARITPVLFFQPHFLNIFFYLYTYEGGGTLLHSKQFDKICASPLFKEFKYIKTFTPMRRPTSSYGGTVRWMQVAPNNRDSTSIFGDVTSGHTLNRSFMIDPDNRLFQDSVLVRFEDGKLNPKATFTALAAFLDVPYTKSMAHCSFEGGRKVNPVGMHIEPVYRAYEPYANDRERYYLELCMRDVYRHYGYDFLHYDGAEPDEAALRELVAGFTTINALQRPRIIAAVREVMMKEQDGRPLTEEEEAQAVAAAEQMMEEIDQRCVDNAMALLRGPRFVNKSGRPLRMMSRLEPDPALLERPMYH